MKLSLLAASMFSIIAGNAALAAPTYKVTDLGNLGGTTSQAHGINDSGQVIGWSATDSGGSSAHSGFLYSNGTITALPTFGGTFTEAWGINNSGKIVGESDTTSGGTLYEHAFLFDSNTGLITDLGDFGRPITAFHASAKAINNNGQIVGNAPASLGYQHAFMYSTSTGVMSDLGTLSGTTSIAYGINDNGQIVGSANLNNGKFHAFLYDGVMYDLGTLGGAESIAYDINASGQIVGWANYNTSNARRAFLYSGGISGTWTNLGATVGSHTGTLSEAYGINDSGQIVGKVLWSGGQTGFLYSGGVMTDLNDLIDPREGWQIKEAQDINNSGQIAAWGFRAGSTDTYALLLTPVPEPETWAMLLAGLGLVGWVARRGKEAEA